MEQSALLRAATQRLANTPIENLPRIAGFIASSLASCPGALNGGNTKPSDTSVPLHKLRTRLSSLLQNRTSAGRLTAAIVIKSVAEVSRPSESSIWESWARGLLGCLNKPDPWEAKRVYLAATVRIFFLARESQTLQREVVTPLLPSFVTACLSVIKPITAKKPGKSVMVTNPLLSTVLRYWNELIQDHPAIFRPFVTRIRPICLSLVSDFSSTAELRHIAAQLLASLHCCIPKATAASEWQNTIANDVKGAHDVLDLIFRGVREDWASNETVRARPPARQMYSQEPELTHVDAAGLGAWKGIHHGAVRVARLLQSVVEMLRCQSVSTATPLGLLLDLTARIGAVTIPSQGGGAQYHLHLNSEVSKEEREALWASLPILHVGSLGLLSEMVEVHGQAISTMISSITEQVFDIFLAEGSHEEVKSQCYACLATILQTSSCASLQLDRQGMEAMCKSCCRDLNILVATSSDQEVGAEVIRDVQRGSTIFKSASQEAKQPLPSNQVETELVRNARILLLQLLEKVPSNSLSHASRTELDRTAILVNHQRAMLASIMNPPGQKLDKTVLPSIMPFLARAANANNLELEAIVRPRMPVISEAFAPALEEVIDANGDLITDPDHGVRAQQQDLLKNLAEQRVNQTDEAGMPSSDGSSTRFPETTKPLHETSYGKRSFMAMTEVQAGAAEQERSNQSLANDFKRARVSEDQNGIVHKDSTLGSQGTIGNGITGAEGSAVEAETLGFTFPFPQVSMEKPPVMYGRADLDLAQKDSDSESDIPSINPELATDDEDEEEDEVE